MYATTSLKDFFLFRVEIKEIYDDEVIAKVQTEHNRRYIENNGYLISVLELEQSILDEAVELLAELAKKDGFNSSIKKRVNDFTRQQKEYFKCKKRSKSDTNAD